MLHVTRTIIIPEREIQLRFIRASGPGGQNVNKVASAVQLRFDVGRSSSLPEDVRQRLLKIAARQITTNGVLIIKADRFRTQQRNRQDAIDRLIAWVRKASVRPTRRRKTQPTAASKIRHRQAKTHRSAIKRLRTTKPQIDP